MAKESFVVMSITRDDLVDNGVMTREQADALGDNQMESIAWKIAQSFDSAFQDALSDAVLIYK